MQRNTKLILIVILPLLMITIRVSHAQPFFKWVDENGATHYTQTPPQQKASEQLTFNSVQKQNKAKLIKKSDSMQEVDRCAQLKKTVAEYSDGTRSTQMESNGEVSLMINGQKVVGARGLAAQYAQECGNVNHA